MHDHVTRAPDRRETTTPNAVMTTLASPTQGASRALSLWQVEMSAGASGPPHVFTSEQLWNLVDGQARVEIDGTVITLAPGDTAVLPAGATRRIHALTDVHAVVCGFGDASVSVPGEAQSRGVPPWIS
jgi:quercetin dioxygenase-like cupin family protein